MVKCFEDFVHLVDRNQWSGACIVLKQFGLFFSIVVQSFEDDNEKCSAKFPSMKGKCPKEPCTMTSCTEAGAVCK